MARSPVMIDSYDNFLEKVGWGDASETRSSKETFNSKKELRRQRAQLITERNKVLGPLEKRDRIARGQNIRSGV